MAQLSAAMGGALVAGDLDGARVVNETIGLLLGRVVQSSEEHSPSGGADAVDLDARRREWTR